jgi:oligopeptide/dipeptide ABC transporter, ATP-binding protein, C-terminal domain
VEQMTDNRQPILELRHISKTFRTDDGREVRAVRDASLSVYPGECVALVGESGCGKSTIARMITRLISPTSGEILLCGRDTSGLQGKELRNLYRDIQMVFQDPYSVFSPRMSVGIFLGEGLVHHGIMNRAQATEEAKKLLQLVELPTELMDRMPHQLSGGQLQRVVVARAVSIRPKVLMLDEATSALDVSVQKQVLELLMRLRKELELTYLFIGHDLAVVRAIADRIAVMYAGVIVEELPSEDLSRAQHPYTQRLLESVFSVHDRNRKVIQVEDMSVTAANQIPGCPFQPRCPRAMAECGTSCPALRELEPDHRAACLAL